jgi:hypothetical protein
VWGYDGTTTSGYNITTSELGRLFYTGLGNGLGNQGLFDRSGTERPDFYDPNGEVVVQNTSPFAKLQLGSIREEARYWSGTEFALNPDGAWAFSTTYGYQEPNAKANPGLYAMAVHAGNIGVPDGGLTAMLLGAGVLALAGARRLVK